MPDLTKLTVYLNPEASSALDTSSIWAGVSRTDCVNRALQIYAAIEQAAATARMTGNDIAWTIDGRLHIVVCAEMAPDVD